MENRTSTDQSQLTFRPSKVRTTLAKTAKGKKRSVSRSRERTRAGNLSKSIMDPEPKNYEKTTVSFVSKLDVDKAPNTKEIFKHLRNQAMGGSQDFFRATSGNSRAKASKLYAK